jgi:hypothetical protein
MNSGALASWALWEASARADAYCLCLESWLRRSDVEVSPVERAVYVSIMKIAKNLEGNIPVIGNCISISVIPAIFAKAQFCVVA